MLTSRRLANKKKSGSDVLLANFDEPLDEGLVVEASYAKLMGKYVIGLRTDVRSPYGPSESRFKGMHFFPAYQCDRFIQHYMPCKTLGDADEQMGALIKKRDGAITNSGVTHQNALPEYARQNPKIMQVINGADLLFGGIVDIHSEKGLEEIAERYLDNRNVLEEIGPKVLW